MARQYHIHIHQIESDNKGIVDFIEGVTVPYAYCDIIVNDVNNLMRDVGYVRKACIHRLANQVAHNTAHNPDFLSIRQDSSHICYFFYPCRCNIKFVIIYKRYSSSSKKLELKIKPSRSICRLFVKNSFKLSLINISNNFELIIIIFS